MDRKEKDATPVPVLWAPEPGEGPESRALHVKGEIPVPVPMTQPPPAAPTTLPVPARGASMPPGQYDASVGPGSRRGVSIQPGRARTTMPPALPTGTVVAPTIEPARKDGAGEAPDDPTQLMVSSPSETSAARGRSESSESRSDSRVTARIDAIIVLGSGKKIRVQTTNMSPRGFLVLEKRKDRALEAGALCQVRLQHHSRDIDVAARVVWSKPHAEGMLHGLEILSLTRLQQAALVQLIEEAREPPWHRRHLPALSVAFLACATLTLGIVIARKHGYLKPAVKVTLAEVTRGDLLEVARATREAEVATVGRVTLTSNSPTPHAMAVRVKRGDHVTAGTVIAETLDEHLAQVLGAAHTKVEAAEIRRARGKDALDRALRAVPLDEAAIARARRELGAATVAVSEAQAELDGLNGDTRQSRVTAPFDGVITDVMVSTGATVPAFGPICNVVDDRARTIRAAYEPSTAERIKVGMQGRVVVPGRSSPLSATVSWVSPLVKEEAQGRSVEVDLAAPSDAALRVGGSVNVEVVVARHEKVLSIPTSAMVEIDGKPSVFVVGNHSRLEARRVGTGAQADAAIEVTSGLEEGAAIVADAHADDLRVGTLVSPER